MKKILFLGIAAMLGTMATAQDLPSNPEPGKCYVRCTTPDVWKNEEVTIQTAPSYKVLKAHGPQYSTEKFTVETKPASSRLEVIPAEFSTTKETIVVKEPAKRLELVSGKTEVVEETVVVKEPSVRLEIVPAVYEEREVTVVVQPASSRTEIVPAVYEDREVTVVVKPAYSRLEVIPAVWGTETVSYVKGTNAPSLRVVPAQFRDGSQTIVTKPASAKWVMGDRAPDCTDADPNACRVWCYTNVPEQTVTVPVKELVKDATVEQVPCDSPNQNGDCTETGTYTKRVLQKPETTREIPVPAVTKTFKKTVMVTPPTTRQIPIPAVTKTFKKTVMVKPPTTREIPIPAVTKVYKKTIITPATAREVAIPAVTKDVTKTVLVKPATTRAVPVSGETRQLTRRVVAKEAWTEESTVPAQTTTITKEVLVSKGGLKEWKVVDCELKTPNPLPIRWNLGSATLTPAAKRIIDERLMPVLNQGVSVVIASHTDARGSKSSNQRLSERRAQAVVNYLINVKGINPSKLTAKGYGETRLTNRCSDGVSCTEAEHAANRRTTFRVISE
jgi:outer membrane protein OmpA-like peptidoglycan-associated protein